MADSDIDLTTGDPAAAADERATRRRRRRSTSSDSTSGDTESRKPTEVRSRLDRVFNRIEKMLRERNDEELATVIHEDGDAMANGITSLVSAVPILFMPIIMALNLIEPVLAFGRVGRILAGRFIAKRTMRAQAQAEAQAEWEQAAAEAEAVPVQ